MAYLTRSTFKPRALLPSFPAQVSSLKDFKRSQNGMLIVRDKLENILLHQQGDQHFLEQIRKAILTLVQIVWVPGTGS